MFVPSSFPVGSDEWFLGSLCSKLAVRVPHVRCMNDWHSGNAPLPVPDSEDSEKPQFRRLRELSRINIAPLIVDARLPRMRVNGVQTSVDDSPDGDDIVRKFFQEQNLRAKLHRALQDSLVSGKGFLVATVNGIMYSSPLNTVCEKDAYGNVVAAMTVYKDYASQENVLLLARPGYTREVRSSFGVLAPNEVSNSSGFVWSASDWSLGDKVSTGIDSVPVYEFDLDEGILRPHIPTFMRINHTLFQRGFLFATQAFKQMGIIGAPDRDDEGNKIEYSPEMFVTAPDALWMLPEGAKMWESSQVDMNPIINALDRELKYVAVESKTPLFMISPDAANGSAEGASTQREILAFDIEELQDRFSATLKRLISDSLVQMGEVDRSDPSGMVIDWVNPRRSSPVELAQAISQAVSAGIPLEVALKKFGGFSPEDVQEAIRARSVETLRAAVATQSSSSFGGDLSSGSSLPDDDS